MLDVLSQLEHGTGLEITFWFNHLDGKLLQLLLSPFHYLGSEIGFMVLLPAIYWAFDKRFGRRTTIMLLGAQYFSIGLKYAFSRPRPFHLAPDRFNPISEYTEPGLPSGHTISGTVIGASFVGRSEKRLAKTLWVLFILLMGFSRLVHGVHYPQDVLAGWIIGFLWFFGYGYVEKLIFRISQAWDSGKKLRATGTISFLVLILVVSLPLDYDAAKNFLSVSALLFGALSGIIVENRKLQFTTESLSPGTRALRIIIGLGSLFSVYALLNFVYYAIAGDSHALWTQLLYFIRYSIVGCWATLGVPWLFNAAEAGQLGRWVSNWKKR